jgi:hypothetical protein
MKFFLFLWKKIIFDIFLWHSNRYVTFHTEDFVIFEILGVFSIEAIVL